MKAAGPEFDSFTATGAHKGWIDERLWRIRTYTPDFDDKTTLFKPGAWFYKNLYGIRRDMRLSREHPEWILRDSSGEPLFIPWGCSDGFCPLHAGDFGDPGYCAWWIAEANAVLKRGYAGVHIDDVNMELRAGNRFGKDVAPVDQRTRQTMADATWGRTMADFVEQIRAALPDVEFVHNAIWSAPDTDPDVPRQLRAADSINLERGINDVGLVRGRGKGLESFLGFIDRRHEDWRAVGFDAYTATAAEREYGLAGYFLVTNARDGLSNSSESTPASWWPGYDVDLGDARGGRYAWKGLLRRDFEDGTVLLNQPGVPPVTVELDEDHLDLEGRDVRSITLGPASGAVLPLKGHDIRSPA